MKSHNSYLLLVVISPFTSGLILPMTKPNGDPDMASIVSHVTLVEHTIASLQTEVQSATTELTTVKANLRISATDLASVTSKLQMTEDKLQLSVAEVTTLKFKQKTTEDELTRVKADLRSAETEIAILKHDLQGIPDCSEFTNLKTEFQSLNVSHESLQKQINSTVIDSISVQVRSSMEDIHSLNSELVKTQKVLNVTATDLHNTRAELGILTSQVVDKQTKLSHTIQDVELRQNISEKDLAATKALLVSAETHMKDVQTKVSRIIGNVTGLSQQVSTIKEKCDLEILFQATQRRSAHAGWTVLRFDSVDYNIGRGYNVSSGIFTAPVTGMYLLWASVRSASSTNPQRIYIYNGVHRVATGYYKETDIHAWRVASVLTVTRLIKGDMVHFTTQSTKDLIGYAYSSYGGMFFRAI